MAMQRTMNRKGFLLIAGVMLLVFLAFYLVLSNQLGQRREQENALRVSLTRLEETNKELNNRLSLVGTEDYIVSSARSDFAYMNKNDLRFEFSNPEALYAYTEEEMKILMDEMAD